MKIVLDTNSLIQSVPRQSRYHIVWESLVKGEHVLCVSNEILEEYLEILQRLTDLMYSVKRPSRMSMSLHWQNSQNC